MDWFEALALPGQIVAGIGAFSTLFFIVKLVLMFIGFGTDTDIDALEADVDGIDALDADGVDSLESASDVMSTLDVATNAFEGLKMFTFQGWMAFLSIGSWSGLYAHSASGMVGVGILVGLIAGFVMMFACAWIIRALFRLQSSGTVDMKKAIGCIGEVYLRIPPKETGQGKINVELNGALREYDAICLDDKPIEYGVRVRIVGMTDDEVMVVQRESEELE